MFYHFDTNPRFPPFLLYVRWKSGVTFVRRCFRDAMKSLPISLSFLTDGPVLTVQTQIRLVLTNSADLEQSDQGLHCLQLTGHLLEAFLNDIVIMLLG